MLAAGGVIMNYTRRYFDLISSDERERDLYVDFRGAVCGRERVELVI